MPADMSLSAGMEEGLRVTLCAAIVPDTEDSFRDSLRSRKYPIHFVNKFPREQYGEYSRFM